MPVDRSRLPYRERADIFALQGDKVYGGLFGHGGFGVYGGGIDPDEDPAEAAAREFLEETGRTVRNPTRLPFDPHVHEWTTPEALAQPRAKQFRGTRTHYFVGELGEPVPGAVGDGGGMRTGVGLYDLADAAASAERAGSSPGQLAMNRRVADILRHLAQTHGTGGMLANTDPEGSPVPFQSKAQQRYMFATMPETAKRWAAHTPDIKKLPEKAGDKKKSKTAAAIELAAKVADEDYSKLTGQELMELAKRNQAQWASDKANEVAGIRAKDPELDEYLKGYEARSEQDFGEYLLSELPDTSANEVRPLGLDMSDHAGRLAAPAGAAGGALVGGGLGAAGGHYLAGALGIKGDAARRAAAAIAGLAGAAVGGYAGHRLGGELSPTVKGLAYQVGDKLASSGHQLDKTATTYRGRPMATKTAADLRRATVVRTIKVAAAILAKRADDAGGVERGAVVGGRIGGRAGAVAGGIGGGSLGYDLADRSRTKNKALRMIEKIVATGGGALLGAGAGGLLGAAGGAGIGAGVGYANDKLATAETRRASVLRTIKVAREILALTKRADADDATAIYGGGALGAGGAIASQARRAPAALQAAGDQLANRFTPPTGHGNLLQRLGQRLGASADRGAVALGNKPALLAKIGKRGKYTAAAGGALAVGGGLLARSNAQAATADRSQLAAKLEALAAQQAEQTAARAAQSPKPVHGRRAAVGLGKQLLGKPLGGAIRGFDQRYPAA